jgi:hypothetical protein
MHQTDIVDYIMILDGEVAATLDSGQELTLTPGHAVVRRGHGVFLSSPSPPLGRELRHTS